MDLAERLKLEIDDNKDVLLATFGYDGLLKSELKAGLIKTIIKEVHEDYVEKSYNELILEFFKVLRRVYMSDAQFKAYGIEYISELILEEQLFMTEEFEGVE